MHIVDVMADGFHTELVNITCQLDWTVGTQVFGNLCVSVRVFLDEINI